MVRFGLVGEGITDQIVLENILGGYFNTADIVVDALQPTRDATDDNKMSNSGNWHKVMTYCESENFREALVVNGEEYYIIIQIDTDIFSGDSVGEPYKVATRNEQGELSSEEILDNVVTKLVELIGEDFYEQHQTQIIFAVSVREIECWLLPLYYQDKKREKVAGCLDTLNKALQKKERFTISTKDPNYYRICSKGYRKQKTLFKSYQYNPSFAYFIQQLEERGIVIEEEEDW